jgi:hypothetical protein
MVEPSDTAIVGDVVVSPFPGGHLIGRMRDAHRDGAAWEYVKAEANQRAAVTFARQLADADGVRAWFFDGDVLFREVPKGRPNESDKS